MTVASRLRPLVCVLAAAVGLAVLVSLAPPASAYPGAPWFEPSKRYTGNFPDPSVFRDGSRFYAYGGSTGGAYLPAMTSTDLVNWYARPAYDPGSPLNQDRYFNDALPYPAKWGVDRAVSGRMTKEVWAPGVFQAAGRYVAFYSVRVQLSPDRFCISVATSSDPLGPFVDNTTGPLVCSSDPAGSIDPQPWQDPATGKNWLLWKNEGVPGSAPTRLWSRELDAAGTAFAPGSVGKPVLTTAMPWEGNLIENPSMARSPDGLWLFYSANEWRSAKYAIGYAKCDTPLGPCRRLTVGPLIRSTATRLGPGGATAFFDQYGRLSLAYHYWDAPYTDYPAFPECLITSCTDKGQRRMATVPLAMTPGRRFLRLPFPACLITSCTDKGQRRMATVAFAITADRKFLPLAHRVPS